MRKINWRFGSMLCIVLMMPLGLFAQDRDLAGKRIGIATGGTDLHWDESAYLGLQNEVIARGGIPMARDAGRSDARQIAQIDELIFEEADVITVLLGNDARLAPALSRVVEAGIPLFTISMLHPAATHVTGVNSFSNGIALALRMAQDLGGRGRLLVFNGFYDVPLCRTRFDMLDYVLTAQTEIVRIKPELEDQPAETIEKAREDVAALLADGVEFDAVWACWDVPLAGALEALDAAGKTDVRVYGFGGSEEILIRLRESEVSGIGGIVALDPAALARAHIAAIADHLNGRGPPPFALVEGEVLHPENISERASAFLPAGE